MHGMEREIVIARRFNGPPGSANGGYLAGLMASTIDGAAQVMLRRPPPLEQPLRLTFDEAGQGALRDGEQLIATVEPTELTMEVPQAPTLEEAEASTQQFSDVNEHVFPHCFVCGPARAEEDGLRIFAGPVAGRELVATLWTPSDSLGDKNGVMKPEFVWAALDCPGANALTLAERDGTTPVVLGTFRAQAFVSIPTGRPYVIAGWPLEREGRKHYAGTAIFDIDGTLLAQAHAVWIEVGTQ